MFKQISSRGMWLMPFLALAALLTFSMMSPVLAQSHIILWDVQGREVGKATMSMQSDDELMFTLDIKDMLPIPGDRRVAVSEVGKCDQPDFASAGEDVEELPTIQFYAGGNANYERVIKGIDLNSFADEDGSALIVYADSADDVTERILCGIIAAPGGSSHESNEAADESNEDQAADESNEAAHDESNEDEAANESNESNEAAHSDEKPEWGYEGENGPDAWGSLDPDYALCETGQSQSPIDIANATEKDLLDIGFNYQPTVLNRVVNNGHTIEVDYDAGSTIQVDGMTFELKQFHFHAPSEHTIDSQHFELEMHLVHQSADGSLAVVGVLIEKGAENAAFAPFWDHLPTEPGEEYSSKDTVNADDLLPASRLSYRYSGSLTTPPCSEDLKWLVLTTPIEMSDAQITTFKNIIDNNNRPVQELNDREIMVDSGEE